MSSATEVRLLLVRARSAASGGRTDKASDLAAEAVALARRAFDDEHPLFLEARELAGTLESSDALSVVPGQAFAVTQIRVDL